MKEFKTQTVTAAEVMDDDRFKLGGEIYRVLDTTTTSAGQTIITFYPINDITKDHNTLIVNSEFHIKVYNQ